MGRFDYPKKLHYSQTSNLAFKANMTYYHTKEA